MEKATWASGGGQAPPGAAVPSRLPWDQPRPLNPSEFPSLEAATSGKPPPASAHLAADATGGWEEDDRRVGGSGRDSHPSWERGPERFHWPPPRGPPYGGDGPGPHERRSGEGEGYGGYAGGSGGGGLLREEPQDWRYQDREAQPPPYYHDRYGPGPREGPPPRGRHGSSNREPGFGPSGYGDRSRGYEDFHARGPGGSGGYGPRYDRYPAHHSHDQEGPPRHARYDGPADRGPGRFDRRVAVRCWAEQRWPACGPWGCISAGGLLLIGEMCRVASHALCRAATAVGAGLGTMSRRSVACMLAAGALSRPPAACQRGTMRQ